MYICTYIYMCAAMRMYVARTELLYVFVHYICITIICLLEEYRGAYTYIQYEHIGGGRKRSKIVGERHHYWY